MFLEYPARLGVPFACEIRYDYYHKLLHLRAHASIPGLPKSYCPMLVDCAGHDHAKVDSKLAIGWMTYTEQSWSPGRPSSADYSLLDFTIMILASYTIFIFVRVCCFKESLSWIMQKLSIQMYRAPISRVGLRESTITAGRWSLMAYSDRRFVNTFIT